jgi:large conductance mechanosensitive channel
MGFFQEFKDFAVKGNAIDVAVGIIIGAAFNKVVTSLVNDVIMPPIGMLLGGVDFKNLVIVLKQGTLVPSTDAVTIKYGLFINTVLDFLVVALTIFVVIKFMNRIMPLTKPAVPQGEAK